MENSEGLEEEIFTNARNITDASSRDRYIQESCGADTRLQNRVRALLRVLAADTSFLESPVQTTTDIDRIYGAVDAVGSVIGPYELVEQIGAGGMGLVFLAQQNSPVRRQVALKIIRPGMDSREVIKRFEAERQTLAQLNHPGITQLLDAGTTDTGRPWFVMELAQGLRITEFCRQNSLSVPDRLRIFDLVCDAVQHAHQNGVIHRDLKPANIVVTVVNGRHVPKVIDFGVARVTQLEGEYDPDGPIPVESEPETILGTPAYMSPEQTHLPDRDLDVRCDVYSLGMLLYELLTDASPFQGICWHDMSFTEARRVIQETSPPPPSQFVRVISGNSDIPTVLAAPLAGIANEDRKKTHPRLNIQRRSGSLQGDLDWITMKALEKDRDRRYGSVAELAADIRRYVNSEPVTARPRSFLYLLRKFAGRRKSRIAITALTVGLVALLFFAATITKSLLNERAELSRHRQRTAEQNRVASEQAAIHRQRAYAEKIHSAYSSYYRGNLAEANRILSDEFAGTASEGDAGFEWHLLSRFCHSSPRTLKDIEGKVFDVEFSPDSRLVVSCIGDRAYGVNIWNAADGILLGSILDFENDVNSLCFSADGTMLLTADESGKVRAWNASTWLEIPDTRLDGVSWPVAQIHLAPDKRSVIASQVLWGVRAAKTSIRTFGMPTDQITLEEQRFLDADSARGVAAFAANDGQISLRQLSDLSLVKSLSGKLNSPSCGCFSADGELIACGDVGGTAKIWRLRNGEERTLPMHGSGASGIRDLAFSTDSRYLITASDDGVVEVWDVASWSVVKLLHSPHGEAWSLGISEDGRRFAVGYESGHIQVHEWSDVLKPQKAMVHFDSAQQAVAASPDAEELATIDAVGEKIDIHSTLDGQLLQSIPAPDNERLLALTYASEGRSLWVCSETGRISKIDLASGESMQRLKTSGKPAPRTRMLTFGSYLAASYIYQPDDVPQVWNTTTDAEVFPMAQGKPNAGQCIWMFCDEHTILASSGKTLSRWNLLTGQEFAPRYEAPHIIEHVGRGPNQQTVLLGLNDGTVHVFDLAMQDTVAVLEGHRSIASASCVSPDGQTIATGSRAGDVILWRHSTHQRLCELTGLTGEVSGLWFTPDGKRLIAAAASADGGSVVMVWDTTGP